MNQETENPKNLIRKAGKYCLLFLRDSVSWVPVFLISLWAFQALAGDAVAIGYNTEGVWTSVTYYSSGKPKGSNDYKTEAKAREEALRDLKKRGGDQTARAEILSSSDVTGFVAVARGTDKSGKDHNVVGRGQSRGEADGNAMAELKKTGAAKNQKIVYRYFSHGAESK
jgi:hypothetical protein